MGFQAAGQQEMERLRDEAEAAHKAHWASNNFTPQRDRFFPGFEMGWQNANAILVSGMDLPGDAKQWAETRAKECGREEGDWEWVHGHVQGNEAAQKAGTRD